MSQIHDVRFSAEELRHHRIRMNHFATIEHASELPVPITTSSLGKLRVRWIESISELESMAAAWSQLAEQSIWRNPFFEPEFLVPALIHLNDCNARCLIVEEVFGKSNVRLLGLVPLTEQRVYGLPLKSVVGWKHDQCFDSTPLLHQDCAGEAMDMMLEFLADEKF